MLTLLQQTKIIPIASSNSFLQKKELNQHAFKQSLFSFIQPKLSIGAPDDIYEKEADAMADKVMRMPMPEPLNFSSPANLIRRTCSHCEKEKELHRKESNSETTTTAPSIVHDVLNSSGGKSLDPETRSFMEPRFNYDFSNVKVHDNDLAAKSADSINALAYTSGNNIVFNAGQYNANSGSGKRLLAHELTHVVQQNKQVSSLLRSKILRSCDLPFSGYRGATCLGTIQVGATTISPAIAGYYHLFILYTDNRGERFYFRGGPGSRDGNGYGNIVVRCAPYVEGEGEYDTANLLEDVYQGPDACNKLSILKTALNQIEAWHIPYVPAGPNSNSVIATLLNRVGLAIRKPAVPTPGFEMAITSTGTTPLRQDRSTTLVLGLGGGKGLLLNAEFQQRLYTLLPVIGGIPLPIPLSLQTGIYGMPDQGRAGGSLGLGTEISLINLPLPRHSPLGLQLGAGATAGVRDIGAPGGTNTELGAYARAGIYTDISRFRIGAVYQYNYLRDVDHGTDSNVNSFLLQLGYTFGN